MSYFDKNIGRLDVGDSFPRLNKANGTVITGQKSIWQLAAASNAKMKRVIIKRCGVVVSDKSGFVQS